jgi:hypothetical protein
VGILINNNLNCTFSEEDTRRDAEENILLARIRINGKTVILGSVYGPNNVCQNFFNNLEHLANSLGDWPAIIGGDWNLTPSSLPVELNPDCLGMAALPNATHSEQFINLCTNMQLNDAYRYFHPTERNFSYIPRSVNAVNKSRIDFFAVSDSLMSQVKDCFIEDNLQSKMFDHKGIKLVFAGLNGKRRQASFSNMIINDPVVELLLQAVSADCHLIYQTRDPAERARLGLIVGQLLSDIKLINPCPVFNRLPHRGPDPEREGRINTVKEALLSRESLEIFDFEINIDPDLFFEMLLNHVKNALTAYNMYINRFLTQEKREKIERLRNLKADPDPDWEAVSRLERELQVMSEREIELKLETHPIFEHINGEKMSPNFLRLAKVKENTGTLDVILKDDGSHFRSEAERREHIVTTFADVYKRPPNCPDNFDNVIENFLGQEICNHEIVRGCKLTGPEAAVLDQPLSFQELDKAVRDCKSRTAPGIDGFNNSFIKKHWKIFRTPLMAYAVTCFRKGRLTENFSTGSIRLIPKKGDLTKIKNWRPISLLNCFYKIIARAVNYRLQKIADRVTSRAQKGFSSSRYMHEVILNVTNGIAYCNANDISGAVVAVDLSKAFDTIYHGFVRSAYKFFGLGDSLINMLDTLGTNRSAQILFDDGDISRKFPLDTGRPQGGNLSPLEFNIGNQILLFKIELSPDIKSVFSNEVIPRNLFPTDPEIIHPDFRTESNAETDKGGKRKR